MLHMKAILLQLYLTNHCRIIIYVEKISHPAAAGITWHYVVLNMSTTIGFTLLSLLNCIIDDK